MQPQLLRWQYQGQLFVSWIHTFLFASSLFLTITNYKNGQNSFFEISNKKQIRKHALFLKTKLAHVGPNLIPWPAQLEKIRWKIPQMLIIDQVFQSLNQFSNGFSAFDSYVWNDVKWQRNCSVQCAHCPQSYTYIPSTKNNVLQLNCKYLQGITGTLQGNQSAGISNLWGLHVYPQSL